ncbi:MAG: hypothetical protein ACXV3A_05470 [Kineosporiaceae bacterium]
MAIRQRSMWSFDPVVLGRAECDAWVGYYVHDWWLVLRAAVVMVRTGFGMPWPQTLLGAWYVLRGNQAWAPYPDNDPDAARAAMRRFYALVARDQDLAIDPARAAELEVDWWREHRILQRERTGDDERALVESLVRVSAYVYGVPESSLEPAAHARALAMRLSDAWVADGCRPDDDRIRAERRLLVESYTRLLDAVGAAVPSR